MINIFIGEYTHMELIGGEAPGLGVEFGQYVFRSRKFCREG